jgi:hypothetical protein
MIYCNTLIYTETIIYNNTHTPQTHYTNTHTYTLIHTCNNYKYIFYQFLYNINLHTQYTHIRIHTYIMGRPRKKQKKGPGGGKTAIQRHNAAMKQFLANAGPPGTPPLSVSPPITQDTPQPDLQQHSAYGAYSGAYATDGNAYDDPQDATSTTTTTTTTTGASSKRKRKRSIGMPYINTDSQAYKSVRDESLRMMEENDKEYGNVLTINRLRTYTAAMEKLGVEPHITGITAEKMEKRFKKYVAHRMPTGDPNCPEHVRRAKRLWRDIQNDAVNMSHLELSSRMETRDTSIISNSLAIPSSGSSRQKTPRKKNLQHDMMQVLKSYMLECPPHKFQIVPGTQKLFCTKCGETKEA